MPHQWVYFVSVVVFMSLFDACNNNNNNSSVLFFSFLFYFFSPQNLGKGSRKSLNKSKLCYSKLTVIGLYSVCACCVSVCLDLCVCMHVRGCACEHACFLFVCLHEYVCMLVNFKLVGLPYLH